MKKRILTKPLLEQFKENLILEERSEATIESISGMYTISRFIQTVWRLQKKSPSPTKTNLSTTVMLYGVLTLCWQA